VADDSRRRDGARSLLGVQICIPGSDRVRPPWCLGVLGQFSQAIQRAFHPVAALPQHMGVNHGRGNVIVPQQLLDRPNVGSALEGVGGEAVPQRVRAGALGDPRAGNRCPNRLLDSPFIEVMPPDGPGAWVSRGVAGRKYVFFRRSALKAWFCVEAATCKLTARSLRNSSTLSVPGKRKGPPANASRGSAHSA
jgi:hypothetical protein